MRIVKEKVRGPRILFCANFQVSESAMRSHCALRP